jgi:hypothetical protein
VANTEGAGLTGPVSVSAAATLVVEGKAASVSGPVNIAQDSYLVLNGGTVGPLTIAYGGYLVDGGVLEGYGTVAGTASVSGTIRAGANIGTTTFRDRATFLDTYFYWTLNALDGTPGNQGVHWNSLAFEGDTLFGADDNPVMLLLEFRGIPDPNSGHPFWNQPHRWLLAQFPSDSPWQAWYDYENFDYVAGSFTVELVGNQAQLVYTPKEVVASPQPARAPRHGHLSAHRRAR